jgi:hypothetical protein
MLITAICAGVVAFSYFELLANVLITRDIFITWAQPLSFVLLLLLTFAIFQTIAAQLSRQAIDLGKLPEQIGRVICGIFLGLLVSGYLLTIFAMAPLPNNYPYQRFDANRPDAEKPTKALLNADGFATGWYSTVSSGSLSGKKSFATLHANFLDQTFLNRHKVTDKIPINTKSPAIQVPKQAAWPAPDGIKDEAGKPIMPKTGHSLTIIRVGFNRNSVKEAGIFTLSQLRLICKIKTDIENPLAGKGQSIYPIGYLKTPTRLQTKRLSEKISMERADFDGNVKWIDFAFHVPDDSQPVTSAKIHGKELATGSKFLTGLTLKVTDRQQWQNAQMPQSIKQAQFTEEGKINVVRALLIVPESTEEEAEDEEEEEEEYEEEVDADGRRVFTPDSMTERPRGSTRGIVKPRDGYSLLSLKCNNPSTGAALKGRQLPVLIEQSGLIHYPVGVVASGKVNDQTIYEFDYCALSTEDTPDGLTIVDETVTKPFPDSVWLTETAQSIDEFYVLYLVKSGRNAIIISVKPGDSKTAASFGKYEGFSIK